MQVYCNRKWRFIPNFIDDYLTTEIDKESSELVDLPHCIAVTELNYFDEKLNQKVCCYQKKFAIPTEWIGKSVVLHFEGAAHDCAVFVNGRLAAHHKCGYTAFAANVGDLLKYGDENLITVRLDSNTNLLQPPFGNVTDYMTYGGIYRDVYFTIKEPCHIEDLFVMPSLLESVETERRDKSQIARIETQGLVKTNVFFNQDILTYTRDGRVFIRQYLGSELLFSQPVGGLIDKEKLLCMECCSAPVKVHLWDIKNPFLYTLRTEILLDNEIADTFETEVGFRTAKFMPDGFYLNNRKVKLIGLNRHQSFPYIGYAATESLQKLDAHILKDELGVNCVRTSHYPQSQQFISECDRLGLLVFTEIPGWQHIGNETWQNQAVANTADMVKQYRNHCSIILWGVRINESADNDELYQRTNDVAHALDPTRQTSGVRAYKKGNVQEDVYAYNDFTCDSIKGPALLDRDDVFDNDEIPYIVSEHNGHMFPTKMWDPEEHRLEQALRHAKVIDAMKSSDGSISGAIGWCMADYNTNKDFGSGDGICYHGVLDMWRNPKLAASVYKAECTSEPFLSVSTSMDIGDHPAGRLGKNYIFTNAESVIMYKGNDQIKVFTPSHSRFKHMKHGPILIDDYIGNTIFEDERFTRHQAKVLKRLLNRTAIYGTKFTIKNAKDALSLMLLYHMSMNDIVPIYTQYIGGWGSASENYHFDAMDGDSVITGVTKGSSSRFYLKASASQTLLTERNTYDIALVRICAIDDHMNQIHYFNRPVKATITGPASIIGSDILTLNGGAGGLLIKSTGEEGDVLLTLSCSGCDDIELKFFVTKEE